MIPNKKEHSLSPEEKMRRIKKRKILKVLIILTGFATMILGFHSLFTKSTPIPAGLCLLLEILLSKYRERLDPFEEQEKKD